MATGKGRKVRVTEFSPISNARYVTHSCGWAFIIRGSAGVQCYFRHFNDLRKLSERALIRIQPPKTGQAELLLKRHTCVENRSRKNEEQPLANIQGVKCRLLLMREQGEHIEIGLP